MMISLEPREYSVVLIDEPAPHVRRITLNRPEKRNALNHALRGDVSTRCTPATPTPTCACRSSAAPARPSRPATTSAAATRATTCRFYTPGGDGHWPRHVTEGG